MLSLLSKSSKIIKFNIKNIGITDKQFTQLPFGRKLDYLRKIKDFQSSPETKKVHISQKRRTNKQAFSEFEHLYAPKEYFYIAYDGKNYRDDSFEIFYRD